MIKIFANSFSFRKIYSLRNTPFIFMIFYFIIITLVVSFPLNYQVIKGDGFKGLTEFTHEVRTMKLEELKKLIDGLPDNGFIRKSGLSIIQDHEYIFISEDKQFTLVVNPKEPVVTATNTIVLGDNETIYFNHKGNKIIGNYSRIKVDELQFSDLKTMMTNEAAVRLFDLVDSTFSQYAVFYSVISNTVIQYLMNIILVLILAAIMLLIKIKFQRVTSFKQNLNLIIASMTIPSLISFITSLLGIPGINSISVVLFQFLTPIIAVISIYKGEHVIEVSKKQVDTLKHL